MNYMTVTSNITNLKKDLSKFGFGYVFWGTLSKLGFAEPWKARRYIEEYYLKLDPEEREQELKEWFYQEMDYPLNLENPKTLNEKIQWLKLYDSTPEKTKLSDKYLVRDWIKEQIGSQYLIPLLGVWDSSEEVDLSLLPNRFVLKANHGSTMNLIVNDAKTLDERKVRKTINNWFHTNFGIDQRQEWHYLNTPHKVLAEQHIGTDNVAPVDYKIYCFNGVPTYIQVIEGRFSNLKNIFLDTKWEPMPFYHTEYERMESVPERPKQLEEIINLSKKLAKGFSLVRIDWYLVGNKTIYFGEMTFTPASGKRHWEPDGTDRMLGDLITLPSEKYIFH